MNQTEVMDKLKDFSGDTLVLYFPTEEKWLTLDKGCDGVTDAEDPSYDSYIEFSIYEDSAINELEDYDGKFSSSEEIDFSLAEVSDGGFYEYDSEKIPPEYDAIRFLAYEIIVSMVYNNECPDFMII